MFKKTKKEVIEMEQTTFVQKHAKKILLAGGVIAAAGAYYILHKHGIELKTKDDVIQGLVQDNINKDKEIGFIKFLVIESDCVPKALQNAENKLARKETKIKELCDLLVNRPNDQNIIDAISKYEEEASILRAQIFNTLKLNELIENDENIYAK